MNTPKKRFAFSAMALGLATAAAIAQTQPTGQWDFNNGNLTGTVGSALQFLPGTEAGTQFGTTTSFGIPDIGGTAAQVMKFPATAVGQGYLMPTPAQPNGGGGLVNDWTIVFDVLFPAESDRKFRALIETDNRQIDADADFFVNGSNGIGIDGQYHGQILSNTWYRVGFVVEASQNSIRKYINGNLVGTQDAEGSGTAALDGRWALTPGSTVELFSDNDGETAVGYVNSIQVRDRALTSGEMLALGGPSAAGISQTIGAIPSFVTSRKPAVGEENVGPVPIIEAVIDPGTSALVAGSIKLSLDGTNVVGTTTTSGNLTTITYTPPSPLPPISQHTVSVVFQDSTGLKTNSWNFKVADYKVINLPAPIALETFDSVPEGSFPAGWVATNRTDSIGGPADLADARSDAYLDWVVISRETLATVHGERRLKVLPVVVNGKEITSLAVTNLAYAESDVRGGNQVQVLFSPDYNLTGKSNIFLSFHSIYEQNQDNINSVEYSIDGGATWLPIVYMIDGPDIIKNAAGEIDAVATLNTARGDQAHGEPFGTWIGATVSQDLAPHISERINDNDLESKRVELFRLTRADNQGRVRLRFMQAGTESWYFGIDNVGLYSIDQPLPPTITEQPLTQIASAGSQITLKVTATSAAALSFQWKKNGVNIPGATGSTLTLSNVQAADAADYTVTVMNSGGSVTSAPAKLEIFAGNINQDLVTHLKFDNSLNDSSSRGNNGTAVGSPAFASGKIGSHAVQILSGSDYVTLGTPADLNFGTDIDFSISFWAKTASWNEDPAFISNKDWNSGGNPGYVLAIDGDGHFQWNLAGSPGTRKDYDGPPGLFSNNNWHHVVVTFDRSGNATTYIDGAQVDSRSLAVSANDLSTPSGKATNIGQDGTGTYGPSFTDASIDDLGIWRRVLTPQEVAAIFNAGNTGKDLTAASVSAPANPPTIATQPQGQIVNEGENISLTVSASGLQPITYQWKRNGADIAGATSNTLIISSATQSHAGSYTVVVSNSGGAITSQPVTVTVNPRQAPGNITQDLVAHLKFDNDLSDSSGNGTSGTAVGSPGFAAGKIGSGALVYTSKKDGSSFNYVTLGSPAQLNFGTNVDFTVSFWAKLDTWEGDPSFIGNKDWNSGGNVGWVVATAGDGRIQWNYRTAGGAARKDYDSAGGIFSDKNWHHIAISFRRNGNAVTYVDGQTVNTTDISPSSGTLDATLPVNIGQDGKGTYTDGGSVGLDNGMIDDVIIWRRALVDTEIKQIFDLGANGQTIGQSSSGVRITAATASGNSLTIAWSGGAGSFVVQKKNSLSDASWQNVTTTSERTVTVNREGNIGFFRVIQVP